MAKGKTAPNIEFKVERGKLKGESLKFKNLKSLPNKYKLVVFGASWCPNCQTDYPKLKEKYADFKAKHDLEVVYISIDTNKAEFDKYYSDAPFITYFDAQAWETQAAKDYHVFATPSYFLLDKNLKILEKIQFVEHLEAWLKNQAGKF